MINLQKSAKNHYKKYNMFGTQDVFVSMAILLIAQTGASYPHLKKTYTLM